MRRKGLDKDQKIITQQKDEKRDQHRKRKEKFLAKKDINSKYQ
jgi:hypothetical protein